jgi:murein DD-endopeptidase MepM/ murein hydrolase activator NlpD
VPEDVFAGTPKASALLTRYTISDGVYSAALRNNVPEPIVREAILLVSKITDLKQDLSAGEGMRLLFQREARDSAAGTGHIIYVGLSLKSGQVDCYVFKIGEEGFRCTDGTGIVKGGNGIFAPVKGARMSSVFGMRLHPLLHIFRLHAGVDWAVQTGTPVMAVANGKVEFAGVAGGFGNHVRLQHDGYETSYSHLDRFAEGISVGKAVAQGDVIGYSGTTGLSTGPHLHFQYYINKVPVDPLVHMEAQNAVPDDTKLVAFRAAKATIDVALAEPPASP